MSALLSDLNHPVLIAPMAGGPSTPQLVTAAHRAGSFGFLALGTTPTENVAGKLAEIAPDVRYGVNLFAPQDPYEDTADIAAFCERLRRDYGVDDELPSVDFTNGWSEKLQAVLDAEHAPAVVSSMFGTFSAQEISQLHERGCEAWVTVTTPEDAVTAQDHGADALVVQGPAAGGHRGTWTVAERPNQLDLADLVEAIHTAGAHRPIIAAGGIRTAADVRKTLALPGVKAVSCGSAFLLADEAGTSEFNRNLLRQGGKSVSTRAFSGRFARGLETEFVRDNPDTPPMYPYLNALLAPLRKNNDPRVAYCLVGVAPEDVHAGKTAEILERLQG